MVKIISTSGNESQFSSDILMKWAVERLGLSEFRADAVVRAVENNITDLDVLTSVKLLEIAAHAAVAEPWLPEDLSRLPTQGLTGATGITNDMLFLASSKLVASFISPPLKPYVECIKAELSRHSDVEFQSPGGLKIENSGDDDDAPRLIGIGAREVTCCLAEQGFLPPRQHVRGLKVTLALSFTDRDSGEDSSGVKRVEVMSVKKEGDEIKVPTFSFSKWHLSTAERNRTKTGSASHDFTICIPCNALDNRRRAFFLVNAKDGAGNASIQIVAVAIPTAVIAQCCGRAGGGGGEDDSQSPSAHDGVQGGVQAGGAPPAAACPCFVKLWHIPIAGDSASSILNVLGRLMVSNPYARTFYHSALEIQLVENGQCVRYVVELQNYVEGAEAQQNVGQILSGRFGGIVDAFSGPIYGIRKWKNGQIEDFNTAAPNPRLVTEDCAKCAQILASVSSIPTYNYASDWTSNSIISWLLERAGLSPNKLPPPPGGIRPGWEEGAAAAQQ